MKKTKFLILRFSSIGDIVLTTPVIRCIKQQYPNAEVHFATKKQFKILLENNPYIDKYFLLDGKISELIKDLKAENYDYIIDLHKNLRTLQIKLQLGKKAFSFDKLNIEKWLLVNFKINRMPAVHIVDRYMKTVETLGIKNDLKGLDYFIPAKDNVNIDFDFVGYAIGGQHFTKKMPTNKIIEICEKIPQKIILLGGKEDFETGETIRKAVGEKLTNACGKYNLNQSASIVSQAKCLITHDTGLMHIGAALQTKIISICGNTVPDFGMYPYLTTFEIVENKNLSCRPCSKIGFDKCPKKHFKCMNDLHIESIQV